MTTIVYDHKNKLIACDSRLTQGSFIATDESKKFEVKPDGVWFFCGNKGEQNLFIETFNLLGNAPENMNVTAMFVTGQNVYLRNIDDKGVFRECLLNFTDGCGSGCEHAINALDCGLDIKQAVEMAAKRDCHTGGYIHVYDINEGEFI